MKSKKLQVGDVIRLKSGGPLMVVEGVIGEKSSPAELKEISYYSGFKLVLLDDSKVNTISTI